MKSQAGPVQIIGAGFSGLTLAYELAKIGVPVEIFEKSARVGGMLGTRRTPHGLAETAANALMLDDNIEALLRELQVDAVRPLPSAKKRFIFRGRPRQWPLSFFESLRLARQFLFHILTRKYFLRPAQKESVFLWSQRNLGSAATKYLVGPALQGIYAGDTQKMSSRLIFGPFFQAGRRKYRGQISGRAGMQEILNALEKKLTSLGVIIHLNSERVLNSVKGLTVVATSAAAAAQVLQTSYPLLSEKLARIEMASLMTVTTFWKDSTNSYHGFGCLIPRTENLRTLGVLINTSIFPDRGPARSETFILGGATDQNVLQLTDDEIRRLIQTERSKIFHCSQDELLEAVITRWPQALPHYTLELERVLEEVSCPENVYLHGNYLGAIGLSKIFDKSKKLAQEIKQKYG